MRKLTIKSIINIIDQLLKNSNQVILRLHTMSYLYDKKIIKEIKSKFIQDKNFAIDEELNSLKSYEESYNDK